MSPRFASFFLIALALCHSGYSQPPETESFTIKAGQSVFVYVVRGECGNQMATAAINGRPLIMPLSNKTTEGSERKTLGYTQLFPQATQIVAQAIAQEKTFVVVATPEQADFVFYVCAAYTEDIMSRAAMQHLSIRSELAIAEARVVPAATYRADKEIIFSPLWKAKTPDAQRPISDGNGKNDGKKKKEKAPPTSAPPAIIAINGVPMSVAPNPAFRQPEFEDLVKYFLQDYAKIPTTKIPKTIIAPTAAANELKRPALTNKPDEMPVEKPRPTIGNQSGEPLLTAKTEPEKSTAETEEILKVDTALIYVPVRVFDKDGKYVPDLTKKEFQVFEDDAPQEIENFSAVDAPFHVVLLLDMSGSTRFKAEEIQDAALEFINQLRPQDRVMVVSFENAVFVDADFTNDRMKLTKAILRTRTGGGTRLYDAVDLVLVERLNAIQGRKAIVLFSDGVDSFSKKSSWQENLSKIEESNVLVYPIQYDTMPDFSQLPNIIGSPAMATQRAAGIAKVKENYDRAKMYMSELAMRSGGRNYEAATLTDAKAAFANIAEELRRQYWLSYYSSNPKSDGSYRKIRVTVAPAADKKWIVRAKNGYRAPKN